MKLNFAEHSLNSLLKLRVSHNSKDAFSDALDAWCLSPQKLNNTLIVHGANGNSIKHARLFAENLTRIGHANILMEKIEKPTYNEVKKIDSQCGSHDTRLVIGIGGGSVLDVVKMVAAKRSVATLFIPTVLSSDCIASPISVLSSETGEKNSYGSTLPNHIYIDLEILSNSPTTFFHSGIGDLISNSSALADLRDGYNSKNDVDIGLAELLSETAYQNALKINSESLRSSASTKLLATSLILSGLSMAIAGNSSPASGTEHLISHAIDKISRNATHHGIQVGLATVYCAHLRMLLGMPSIDSEAIDLLRRVGFPKSPESVGISRIEFLDAVRLAPTTRPGRQTYLSDDINTLKITKAYEMAFYRE